MCDSNNTITVQLFLVEQNECGTMDICIVVCKFYILTY